MNWQDKMTTFFLILIVLEACYWLWRLCRLVTQRKHPWNWVPSSQANKYSPGCFQTIRPDTQPDHE